MSFSEPFLKSIGGKPVQPIDVDQLPTFILRALAGKSIQLHKMNRDPQQLADYIESLDKTNASCPGEVLFPFYTHMFHHDDPFAVVSSFSTHFLSGLSSSHVTGDWLRLINLYKNAQGERTCQLFGTLDIGLISLMSGDIDDALTHWKLIMSLLYDPTDSNALRTNWFVQLETVAKNYQQFNV